MKNYVEVGRKGQKDHLENIRLDIPLSSSDSNLYSSVNYRKLVALKQGYTNEEFLEMEDAHDRFKDYVEESYIDNSEVFRDTYPPNRGPENMGFYINYGKLKLKPTSSERTHDHDKKHREKKKHKQQHKERKRSKSDKHSNKEFANVEANPVSCADAQSDPLAGLAESVPPPPSMPSHERITKEERKKLKLLRKEKKSRDFVEETKSPKKRKKRVDEDVTLDKILMSRAKEVKSSEGKLNKSSNYVLVPDLRNGLYPYYNTTS
ncbi:uncharacterized protein [Parasteatoda tepidariorum]|uniref:uncharacterized protein n=1 Tax=Parasteatoda tepidariorum TaxID=114398 RepID=UPI00077FB255|nr:uncharacterized protein LOC107438228 [Parasteatoda tepidariorum]